MAELGPESSVERPPDYKQYYSKILLYWVQENLQPERLLTNPLSRIKVDIKDEGNLCARRDMESLNFFLCQDHLFLYEIQLQGTLNHLDHYEAWKVWIKKYISFLLKDSSNVTLAFKNVFDIKGDIFVLGKEGFTRE